jgi:ATP-binding cassette subfamily F protein 3
MATGSGKTIVMAMLIAWQVLNKAAYPQDARFSKNIFIVAPGLTVKSRLSVLIPTAENNYYDVLEEIQHVAKDEPEQRLRALLGAFLFSGDDVYKKVEVLSGGEKARLSIAKMLIRPANFLLMDEPTNHLDINSREVLSDALDAYQGTLCFITHDRTLIREIATKIVEIVNGIPVVFQGNYDEYLEWKERLIAGLADDPQNKENSAIIRDNSPKEIQRQRKIAEGELRNNFFRVSSPLKKRISEIETELEKLEGEFHDLENYFATPEAYGDSADIVSKTKRHSELKILIGRLTDEWGQLSEEFERQKQEFENAKKDLEAEYTRYKDAS